MALPHKGDPRRPIVAAVRLSGWLGYIAAILVVLVELGKMPVSPFPILFGISGALLLIFRALLMHGNRAGIFGGMILTPIMAAASAKNLQVAILHALVAHRLDPLPFVMAAFLTASFTAFLFFLRSIAALKICRERNIPVNEELFKPPPPTRAHRPRRQSSDRSSRQK